MGLALRLILVLAGLVLPSTLTPLLFENGGTPLIGRNFSAAGSWLWNYSSRGDRARSCGHAAAPEQGVG